MNVTTTLETITPARAKTMLDHNTKNRALRPAWVRALARCITEGRWHVTHQGIAFNGDGSLLDGQHRLEAVVLANKPAKMLVTRGLTCESMYAIDGGKTRSVCDIAGPLGLGLDISKDVAAVARMMMVGFWDGTKTSATRQDVVEFLIANHEAITFAVRVIPKGSGVAHSCIRAVVGRAWYAGDVARLEQFGDAYSSGITNGPNDGAAALLRTTYLRDRKGFGGPSGRRILYRKASAAVRAFLQRRPMTKLYEAESEVFLLPEEQG
jgi:hypothetical protein